MSLITYGPTLDTEPSDLRGALHALESKDTDTLEWAFCGLMLTALPLSSQRSRLLLRQRAIARPAGDPQGDYADFNATSMHMTSSPAAWRAFAHAAGQIMVSPSVTFGLEDAAAQMAHTLTPTLARIIPTFDTSTLPTMSVLVFAEGALIYPECLYTINSIEQRTLTRGDLHNSGLIHMAGFEQGSSHGKLATRHALTQRLARSAHLIGLHPEQLRHF